MGLAVIWRRGRNRKAILFGYVQRALTLAAVDSTDDERQTQPMSNQYKREEGYNIPKRIGASSGPIFNAIPVRTDYALLV